MPSRRQTACRLIICFGVCTPAILFGA